MKSLKREFLLIHGIKLSKASFFSRLKLLSSKNFLQKKTSLKNESSKQSLLKIDQIDELSKMVEKKNRKSCFMHQIYRFEKTGAKRGFKKLILRMCNTHCV